MRFTSKPYVLLPLYVPDLALPPGAKLLSMRAANPRVSELFEQVFRA